MKKLNTYAAPCDALVGMVLVGTVLLGCRGQGGKYSEYCVPECFMLMARSRIRCMTTD